MENKTVSSDKNNKNPRVWRISTTTPNGITTEVQVEEAKGGFVIRKEKWGYIKKNGKEEHINKKELYVSKKNPLEGLVDPDKDGDVTTDPLDGIDDEL